MNPTYLYIKKHTVTGMKYLGKTKKNPNEYLGSGKYWLRHIKTHGTEHVITLWSKSFTDNDDLSELALFMSQELNIVSDQSWANLIVENGLDGCPSGTKRSDETKAKISAYRKGRPISQEAKIKLGLKASARQMGRKLSQEHKENIRLAVIQSSRDSTGRFI